MGFVLSFGVVAQAIVVGMARVIASPTTLALTAALIARWRTPAAVMGRVPLLGSANVCLTTTRSTAPSFVLEMQRAPVVVLVTKILAFVCATPTTLVRVAKYFVMLPPRVPGMVCPLIPLMWCFP